MKNLIMAVVLTSGIVATSHRSDADPKPIALVKGERAAPAGVSPRISIVRPAELAKIPTRQIERRSNGMHYYEIDPVDPKQAQIVLDVKSWKVSPGGNGIVLVLDNMFVAEVHDLGKPLDVVKSFDLRTTDDPNGQLGEGWHFIAAFPVTANNIAVDATGALAVVHFLWGAHDDDLTPDAFKQVPQLVVNRAALGPMVRRNSDGSLGGRLLRDRSHVALDLLLWVPPGAPRDCIVPVTAGEGDVLQGVTSAATPTIDVTSTTKVKAPGLYYLSGFDAKRFDDESEAAIGAGLMECPPGKQVQTGGWAGALIRIFVK